MNTHSSLPLGGSSMDNISSGSGSGSTVSYFSFRYLCYFSVSLLLVYLLYLAVSFFINRTQSSSSSSASSSFHANRENVPATTASTPNKATLLFFYTDWCPHCKTAKPDWQALKDEQEGGMINGYVVSFVEHNCTTESDETAELMNRYNIEGYPTIKLAKDNQIIEYDAKPSKATLEQFLHTVL